MFNLCKYERRINWMWKEWQMECEALKSTEAISSYQYEIACKTNNSGADRC